jgi:CheY-like chemotaxis protein
MSIRIQVLLVEDDEISAQAARTLLERLGCVVDHAIDGAEAIELFGRESYDLILMDGQMPRMDGQMPRMDGLETTAKMRSMAQGWVTPIVGTSSNLSRVQCLDAGMNDIMPKPFLLSALKMTLAKWTLWEDDFTGGIYARLSL